MCRHTVQSQRPPAIMEDDIVWRLKCCGDDWQALLSCAAAYRPLCYVDRGDKGRRNSSYAREILSRSVGQEKRDALTLCTGGTGKVRCMQRLGKACAWERDNRR